MQIADDSYCMESEQILFLRVVAKMRKRSDDFDGNKGKMMAKAGESLLFAIIHDAVKQKSATVQVATVS